jgi:uncharacterized membrane protein YphA (DoxX/SURF4 family)
VHVVVIAASLSLGLVFVVAAVLKIASPRVWRAQAAGLGVPSPVASVVPWIELSIGALLVAQIASGPVAAAAAAMLVAFTAVLATRLRQGRRPPCACFGNWSSKPIGWSDVARNAVFIALAAVVVIGSAIRH